LKIAFKIIDAPQKPIKINQNIGNVVGEALKNIEQQQLVRTPGTDKAENKSQVIEDAPIIKIVDVILSNAIESFASDIHIEPSAAFPMVQLHGFLGVPFEYRQSHDSRQFLPNALNQTRLLWHKLDPSRP
jgi:hypothetical protein